MRHPPFFDMKEENSMCLPTPRIIHEEIDLPLEYIAAAFQCSRNTLNKYMNSLPDPHSVQKIVMKEGQEHNSTKKKNIYKVLDYVKSQKDITDILDLYDSAIHNYKAANYKSGTVAEIRWKQTRDRYKAALEADLAETEKTTAYLRNAGAEIKQYQKENNEKLLNQCKEGYANLNVDIALKIAYYYEAYIKLFCFASCKPELILPTLSIMTSEAKREVILTSEK